MEALAGLLLLDKPSGPTSHDMVALVRRGAGLRRVGHAGTLDPLATGLLVLCLGTATRLSEYLAGHDKRYVATFRLGQATTTYDAQGEVTTESAALPDRPAVESALAAFRGRQLQAPPAYSAIKLSGRKAYDLARRGEAVHLAPREVEFYELRLADWSPPECTLEVHSSAGTYIRSLAHDLGQRLGCGAHLSALRRTAAGSFEVSQSAALPALEAAFRRGDWQRWLLPADAGLLAWPQVPLDEIGVAAIRQGRAVPLLAAGAEYGRAYSSEGEFFAILRADPAAGVWRPHKVLTAGAGG